MRVLVTGGRNFNDKNILFETLGALHATHAFSAIIHGGANGADHLAGEWAATTGVQTIIHYAEWNKHGLAAGPIRNTKMLEEKPDLVVAFPGGKGTADMVRKAKTAGLRIIMVGTKQRE